MLTEEQVKEYIADEGNRCPYCKSQDIEARETDYCGNQLFQLVYCYSCGATWSDQYLLIGIEEDEGK